MKMLIPIMALILVSGISPVKAQTCVFKANQNIGFLKENFEEELALYSTIVLNINGKIFSTIDTGEIIIPVNQSHFDTIRYTYTDRNEIKQDTFICKLRQNEVYTISPCTCCGIFLITPEKNAKRGFIKFENRANQDYIAMFSEAQYDTIPKHADTEFLPSYISMNCGFRPSDVVIAKKEYLNPKYDYENWSKKPVHEIKALKKEQESHILFKTQFLFLHEEKLIVAIDQKAKNIRISLSDSSTGPGK